MSTTLKDALIAVHGTPSPIAAFPVIELGFGKVEIGDSIHDFRVPALWFGKDGQGVGASRALNRYAANGETLAVVAFENVAGLDVLLDVLERIRSESFPLAPARVQA